MRTLVTAAISTLLIAIALSSASVAQTKTATQCRDEWRAAKADFQAKGITERAYVAQCRAGAAAKPGEPPGAAPTPPPEKPAATPRSRRTAAPKAAPAAAGQFSTETEAKATCPSDTV